MTRVNTRRRLAFVLAVALFVSGCDGFTFLPGTPRPTACDPTDTAVNDGHTAAFFTKYTVPKGPLSQRDCKQVVDYLRASEDFVARLSTVGAAKAAGWIQVTVWTPGQGIHFADPARMNGPFDPRRPNWLQYNGTADTARLVGMMYLVENGSNPPAGFPGANDHWHNHDELCVDADAVPMIIGEHLSDAVCAAIGGVNTDYSTTWMVHAWFEGYGGWIPTDVFNNNHPALT
jgi:hypothetical protein